MRNANGTERLYADGGRNILISSVDTNIKVNREKCHHLSILSPNMEGTIKWMGFSQTAQKAKLVENKLS